MHGSEPKLEYSRQDVRRMLEVSERQLRSWERQGLIPAAAAYTFSDLIALKSLQKLREHRVAPKQIGRALASLKTKLSGVQHPLSELKILCDGRKIMVQVSGRRMEAISGQMLFDFETEEISAVKLFPEKTKPNRAQLERESEHWFQRGLALEETDAIEEAVEAYKKSISLNPAAAGSLVNLGTIYYRRHDFDRARESYMSAIEADRNYPLAYFNLGNLYDEQGDPRQAAEYYTGALRLNPNYADAHFNLALLCEKAGDALKAVYHWKAYLKLDGSSSWAAIARRQLEKLKQSTLIRSS